MCATDTETVKFEKSDSLKIELKSWLDKIKGPLDFRFRLDTYEPYLYAFFLETGIAIENIE